MRLAHMVGVFGEDAAFEDGWAALERFLALGQFAGADIEGEEAGAGVDGDLVAILD